MILPVVNSTDYDYKKILNDGSLQRRRKQRERPSALSSGSWYGAGEPRVRALEGMGQDGSAITGPETAAFTGAPEIAAADDAVEELEEKVPVPV